MGIGHRVAVLSLSLVPALGAPAQGQQEKEPTRRFFVWAEEVSLEDLLAACAEELGLSLDYDPGSVDGRVAIRASGGIAAEDLWETTGRLLLEQGLTSIQGSSRGALSIVPVEKAPALARVERGNPALAQAGYIKYLHYVPERRAERMAEGLRSVFGRAQSGLVAPVGVDYLMLQGPKPTVLDALDVLSILEAGPEETVLEEYPARNLTPKALAALLEQVVQKTKGVDERGFRGSVLASAHSSSVYLIAPAGEIERWRVLARRLDRTEPAFTRTYTPRRFGLSPTVELVERVFAGTSESLRLVADELTGTMIVTTSPALHLELEALLERLEDTPWAASRVLRSFPVEHRDAEELLELLQSLLSEGPADPRVVARAETPETSEPSPQPPPVADLPWEDVSLSLDQGTNRILAFGDTRLLDELQRLVEALDVPHSQVLIEAAVVSLSESELRDLGVELRRRGSSDGTTVEVASLFGLGGPTLDDAALSSPGGSGLTGIALDPGRFSVLLRALETVSDGRTVNLPRLLVSNHANGGLDSVLQTPYLSTNATNTVATTSLGGTLDAGTSISVTPHITDGWRLRLEVTISVSSFVGEAADPNLPPPRQENRLETEVSLPDGHTAVVGGLEVTSTSDGESRVPLFGRLPLVGALFRSSSTRDQHSRLFVFLRCNVIRRHGFEDLRHWSQEALRDAGHDDGWPQLEPRIIR